MLSLKTFNLTFLFSSRLVDNLGARVLLLVQKKERERKEWGKRERERKVWEKKRKSGGKRERVGKKEKGKHGKTQAGK